MIGDEKKKLLALHRLQQATESLEEARYLFDGGKIPEAFDYFVGHTDRL